MAKLFDDNHIVELLHDVKVEGKKLAKEVKNRRCCWAERVCWVQRSYWKIRNIAKFYPNSYDSVIFGLDCYMAKEANDTSRTEHR